MRERSQETVSSEAIDDVFEPVLGDLLEEDLADFMPATSEKQRLAEKRRRAEQRLEEKRMREELGFDDLKFDDF